MPETSTKPYLLRALYEWCTDNGYTPYIVVVVDASTRVPAEFVKNGEIVLNISFEATGNLKIDNDFIHFKARFGGVAREIEVPVSNVSAIYARENGQGMAFEVQRDDDSARKSRGASRRKHRRGKYRHCFQPYLPHLPTRTRPPMTTISPTRRARVEDRDSHGSNNV
jgi:stringent starvation protein B